MAKEYSSEEIQRIWKKVKEPTMKELLGMIENLRSEAKDFQNVILRRTLDMHDEIRTLDRKLRQDVEYIKSLVPSRVVVIEEKTREQAKKEVRDYFEEHGTADLEDLMLNLKTDVRTLVEVIDELREEGVIEESEETGDS